MKMSECNKVFLFILILSCLEFRGFSQGRIWFSELGATIYQDQKVDYANGSFSHSPALGYFLNINTGGKHFAIGVQGDYSSIDLKSGNNPSLKNNNVKLWEFYAILRYYPMLPTMRFWTKGAIRFTAGVSGGAYSFYWRENDNYNYPTYSHLAWSPLQFSSVIFGGLCFSSFRNTSGLSLKLNYKPTTYSMSNFPLADFTLKQPFSVSASLFIGPSIK